MSMQGECPHQTIRGTVAAPSALKMIDHIRNHWHACTDPIQGRESRRGLLACINRKTCLGVLDVILAVCKLHRPDEGSSAHKHCGWNDLHLASSQREGIECSLQRSETSTGRHRRQIVRNSRVTHGAPHEVCPTLSGLSLHAASTARKNMTAPISSMVSPSMNTDLPSVRGGPGSFTGSVGPTTGSGVGELASPLGSAMAQIADAAARRPPPPFRLVQLL